MVIGGLAAGRAPRAGGSGAAPAASAGAAGPLVPPPLPSGAEPEAIAIPEDDAEPSCDFPDRGFGAYGAWRPLPLGKLLVAPEAVEPGGGYDLLVHFHGAEPVRKELAPLELGLVVAAVDAGTRSSDYARAMAQGAWEALRASIDRAVAEAAGIPAAHARRVAVSSWSAGSGAVARILVRPDLTFGAPDRAPRGAPSAPSTAQLDALILLDSLYAGYAPGRADLVPGQLAPYVAMASAAARGGPLFYLTHTAVPTYGYASTGEAASFLLRELGASPIAVSPTESDPFQLTRMYDGGSLFVRGYAGASREDHCAQLRLLPSILAEHLLPALGR